jgi:3-phosphoshikimate 1-carboxyvinyltransferase
MRVVVAPPSPSAEPLSVEAPASKSFVLRAAAIAAARGGGVVYRRGEDGGDVRAFLDGAVALGAAIERDAASIRVHRGYLRRSRDPATIRVEDGAAPARFLLAAAAASSRAVDLRTGDRLARRPFAGLVRALRTLGATIDAAPLDAPPFRIVGPAGGGFVRADLGAETGQFLSALLLLAPMLGEPLEIEADGVVRSAGYVAMTVDMLRRAGVSLRAEGGWFLAEPGFDGPEPRFDAPVDWSSAAPLLAAGAILERRVVVRGLRVDDPQPDAAFAKIAAEMGCDVGVSSEGVFCAGRPRRGGEIDVGPCPDLAPTLAVLAAFAPGGASLRGAPDRVFALARLLRAAGVPARERDDGLDIEGVWVDAKPEPLRAPFPAAVEGDHRLAQAAALLALIRPAAIDDAACVQKSFPGFFDVFPTILASGESP